MGYLHHLVPSPLLLSSSLFLFILSLLSLFPSSGDALHVAFISDAERGHLKPLIGMALEATKRGHNVTFFCGSQLANWTRSFGVENVVEVGNTMMLDEKYREKVQSEIRSLHFRSALDLLYLQTEYMAEPILEELMEGRGKSRKDEEKEGQKARDNGEDGERIGKGKGKGEGVGKGVDIAVVDFFALSAYTALEYMDIPFVVNVVGNLKFDHSNPSSYLPVPYGTSPYPTQLSFWERLSSDVRLRFTTAMMRVLSVLVNRQRENFNLPPVSSVSTPVKNVPKLSQSSSALEPPGSRMPDTFFVGPTTHESANADTLPPPLLSWLDKAEEEGIPVIFIAFGSVFVPSDSQAKTLFDAFSGMDVRVVWAASRLASDKTSILYHNLSSHPPNFRIETFVPQTAVLHHPAVKVFLSHCGFNSMAESMVAGKPILASPLMADQPYYAQRVVEVGAGLLVDWSSPAGMRQTASELISNRTYAANAMYVGRRMEREGGAQRAVDLIEEFALDRKKWREMEVPSCNLLCTVPADLFLVYSAMVWFGILCVYMTCRACCSLCCCCCSRAKASKKEKKE
uniref:UDP-glycosyltransferases domain-containing protein n=1 Tax=Palpitomonas bilix TaxID=652834 RepID=A0A7S3LWS4_9EUKA|mmetsp:Transcript_7303/g.18976  ORF Transcript_7303/g.18976 Transcript_7303/m.18976 type:complete len:569 (+) Transcript_7303:89-1795(+)